MGDQPAVPNFGQGLACIVMQTPLVEDPAVDPDMLSKVLPPVGDGTTDWNYRPGLPITQESMENQEVDVMLNLFVQAVGAAITGVHEGLPGAEGSGVVEDGDDSDGEMGLDVGAYVPDSESQLLGSIASDGAGPSHPQPPRVRPTVFHGTRQAMASGGVSSREELSQEAAERRVEEANVRSQLASAAEMELKNEQYVSIPACFLFAFCSSLGEHALISKRAVRAETRRGSSYY